MKYFWVFLTLLASCATSTPWIVDAISSGYPSFHASRLRYQSQTYSPLHFEIVKLGDQVAAYFSLHQARFSQRTPKLIMKIEEKSFEEYVPSHEGQMKLRLPAEVAERLIQALQEGKKVGILLDRFEETLDPQEFALSFSQFLGKPV